ncbi:MAG: hypothetical protein IIC25_04945 [Chloroflexi bacterium]|nr:hypothetical protein [Chloroflexota bacterium]
MRASLRAMMAAGGESPALVHSFTSAPIRDGRPIACGHAMMGRKVIEAGDFLKIDICGVYYRYHGNVQRGYIVGDPPKAMIENLISAEEVKAMAQDETIQATFKKAVKGEGLEIAGQAQIESIEFDQDAQNCSYVVLVPLAPKVELGEYKGLKADKFKVVVTQDEIGRQVDELRTRGGKKTKVDRGIKSDDNALVNIKTEDDDGEQDRDDEQHRIRGVADEPESVVDRAGRGEALYVAARFGVAGGPGRAAFVVEKPRGVVEDARAQVGAAQRGRLLACQLDGDREAGDRHRGRVAFRGDRVEVRFDAGQDGVDISGDGDGAAQDVLARVL